MPLFDVANNRRFPGARTVLKTPLPQDFGLPKSFGTGAVKPGESGHLLSPGSLFITDNVQPGDKLFITSADFGFPLETSVDSVVSEEELFMVFESDPVWFAVSFKVGFKEPFTIHSFAQVSSCDVFLPLSVHHAAVWVDADISLFAGDETGDIHYIDL